MTPGERSRADEAFRSPPARCRSLPFWAWNAELDEEELAAQVRSFKAAGMGGFFMHSRDGLETPYMGEAWAAAVRRAVRTAREEGLTAWIYDEDRWPSGSAGGKVPARGDAYRAKGLTLEIRDGDYEPGEEVVALFGARTAGLWLEECARLDPAEPARSKPGYSLLIFRIEVAAPDEWFNGESPPDNMNPAAVDAFLELNYEPYARIAGESFGGTVPGVFTDEPSVHDRHSRYPAGRGWIPWTCGFAEFFASRRGYDPLDAIPLVFFDGRGQSRIRHDYWRTVTELFSETYSKRIGRWCAERGLAFTGHFLWENQLGIATRTGGAVMPHYRFQDIPAMDLLCEQIEETITVKQCASVAHQYGRPRVLSETYGCAGWEFSFEGQKWLGDWQYALGVNLRSQHLALYSLKGCRKRDYPPVFNYNTTWWRQARIVEDYFARLSLVLTEGEPVRDLLVLHPASTAWCLLGSNPRGSPDRESDRNLRQVNALGDDFNRFLRAILGAHHDFDLGDETILAEAGRAEGGSLFVGSAAYRLVVIPPGESMLRSTLELLAAFLDGGGRMVAVAPRAGMLEGVPSADLEILYRHPNATLVDGPAAAIRAIENLIPRPASLLDRYLVEDPEILCMFRRAGQDRALLFAVNADRTKGRDILVELEGEGAVEELDALTGEIRPIEAENSSGKTRFMAAFGPAGSRLYRVDFGAPSPVPPGAAKVGFSPTPNFLVNPPILGALGPTARFRRGEPNALVLDLCSYELEGGGWSRPMELWRAQKEIRAALGMRQVYYNGLEQRYLWAREPHPRDGARAAFRFSFEVKDLPAGELFLVLEDAEDFRIDLNGARFPSTPRGWFLDKSFRKVPISGLVRGKNELVLSCAYENRMEVEDCFLLGDFAVDAERALVREPGELRFGDWCLQGYPHYCGSMVYVFDLERPAGRVFLRLGEFSAVTVEVRANGRAAGQIPWRSAGDLDLTGFLREGTNSLEIEVVGSPRNLLGPFHLARGKVAFTEWSAFRPEGADYTPGYVLQPYGLFGQAILVGG